VRERERERESEWEWVTERKREGEGEGERKWFNCKNEKETYFEKSWKKESMEREKVCVRWDEKWMYLAAAVCQLIKRRLIAFNSEGSNRFSGFWSLNQVFNDPFQNSSLLPLSLSLFLNLSLNSLSLSLSICTYADVPASKHLSEGERKAFEVALDFVLPERVKTLHLLPHSNDPILEAGDGFQWRIGKLKVHADLLNDLRNLSPFLHIYQREGGGDSGTHIVWEFAKYGL
jgi:hypothetical protein